MAPCSARCCGSVMSFVCVSRLLLVSGLVMVSASVVAIMLAACVVSITLPATVTTNNCPTRSSTDIWASTLSIHSSIVCSVNWAAVRVGTSAGVAWSLVPWVALGFAVPVAAPLLLCAVRNTGLALGVLGWAIAGCGQSNNSKSNCKRTGRIRSFMANQ